MIELILGLGAAIVAIVAIVSNITSILDFLSKVQNFVVFKFHEGRLNEIKVKKARPFIEQTCLGINTLLGQDCSAPEIEKKIQFKPGSGIQPTIIGGVLVIPISEDAIKQGTLDYLATKNIGLFVFSKAVGGKFNRVSNVRSVVIREIIAPAMVKVELEYENQFMGEQIVDEDMASDLGGLLITPGYFKREITPLLDSGSSERDIISKIKADYKKIEKQPPDNLEPVSLEHEPVLTEEQMLELTLREKIDNAYKYVRVLKFVVENPNCEPKSIVHSTNILPVTVQWALKRHLTQTKFIKKLSYGHYSASDKYSQARKTIEEASPLTKTSPSAASH